MDKIIEVNGLKKSYGEVSAVKGISFYVEAGKLFAFLGPNGAGKSTTIDILCSLLPFDEGEVSICGHKLGSEDAAIRQDIGVVFQHSVLDTLLNAARDAGVELRTGFRVESLGGVDAKRVILATGGRSVPKTGSDGLAREIARAAGHTVTPTFPALVPLVIASDHWMKTISGTSAEVELSVVAGRVVRRECGSMLMTHFGISGPVVLDISRHWIAAQPAKLVVNFLPGQTFESVDRTLVEHARGRSTVRSVLRSVPERVIEHLAPPDPIAKLSRETRRDIARALTEFEIPVTRDRGFDYAEVTAGGVPLSEVDLSTMQSRVRPGLYLCGEILDVDGKIGGFNFQWAWASGRLAGIGVTRSL
jgi:predicted Rossmann fold flavoprotein